MAQCDNNLIEPEAALAGSDANIFPQMRHGCMTI